MKRHDKKRFWHGMLAGIMLLGAATFAMPCSSALAATATPEEEASITQELGAIGGAIQPIGEINPYNDHFTGISYLVNRSTDKKLPVANVTFAHGAHTFWHVHHNSCQVLVAESGRGYYQIWGQKPVELRPGMVVTIPAGVKHWHGAAPHTSFQHIALMQQGDNITTEWLEPVSDEEFNALP